MMENRPSKTTTLIHQYLERLSNLLRAEARRSGQAHALQPVHIDALHYLNCCNRYSDTPQAVTDYLGLTKGTVSQTLNVLEHKGLVAKVRDDQDKRIVHLCVTSAGRRLLQECVPSPQFDDVCSSMSELEQEAVVRSLQMVLRSWQRKQGMRAFGQCKTCRHNTRLSDGRYFCELTREALAPADVELLCREHASVV